MLCDNCQNHFICKYCDMLKNAPFIFEIKTCEKFQSNNTIEQNKNITQLNFRKPIDYESLGMTQNLIEDKDDNEEKIIIDTKNNNIANVVSFTDILLGGQDEEER